MTLSPQTQGQNGALVYLTGTTLTGIAASIDIQNIPTSFTAIRIIFIGRSDNGAASTLNWAANGDAVANNYTSVTTGGVSDNSQTCGGIPGTDTSSVAVFDCILTSGTFRATLIGPRTGGAVGCVTQAHVWKSTDAVNRLTFTPIAGNLVAGTKVMIYGIR